MTIPCTWLVCTLSVLLPPHSATSCLTKHIHIHASIHRFVIFESCFPQERKFHLLTNMLARAGEQNIHTIYTVWRLTLCTCYMDTPHSTCACPNFHFYLNQLISLFLRMYLYWNSPLYSQDTYYENCVFSKYLDTLTWHKTWNRDVMKCLAQN